MAPPIVNSVAPKHGPVAGGNSVVIAGQFLTGATDVSFGIDPAFFAVDSDAQITAVAPAHAAGTVEVFVTTPEGTN